MDFERADKFNRDLMIRKYFCTWIERFIEKLKANRT